MNLDYNYKQENRRYQYYFKKLNKVYQQPVAQVSTALLLTLFTIIFFAAFAIRPTLATIAELIRKIDDQRKVLVDLKKKATALGVVQSEYALVAGKLAVLDEAVPGTPKQGSFLKMIEALASMHNVKVSNINSSDVVIGSKREEASNQPKEITSTITVEAPYPELKKFIDDLARLPRLATVDSIRFAPSSVESKQSNPPVRLIISVKAYYAALN